jgi:hypothetical protein
MAFQDLDTATPRDDNSIDPNRAELRDLKERLKTAEQNNFGLIPLKTGDILRSSRYFMDLEGEGFLPASGQEVSRTTYADLFAEIGEGYGAGDGSTTFNVPDDNEGFLPLPPGSWVADNLAGETNESDLVFLASPQRGRRFNDSALFDRLYFEVTDGTMSLIYTHTGTDVYRNYFFDSNDELNFMYKVDSNQSTPYIWKKYDENTGTVVDVNTNVLFYQADKTTLSARGSNSVFFYTSEGLFAIEGILREVYMWDATINGGAGGMFLVDTVTVPDYFNKVTSSPNYPYATASLRLNAGFYKLDFTTPTSVVVQDLGIPSDPDNNVAYYAGDYANGAYWAAVKEKWYRRTNAVPTWTLTSLTTPYADTGINTKVAASEGTNSLYLRPVNALNNGTFVTPLADSAPKVISFVKT